jgi:hypothetical protein
VEFRWIALITMWTLLAGPMFDSPSNHNVSQARPTGALKKPVKPPVHAVVRPA